MKRKSSPFKVVRKKQRKEVLIVGIPILVWTLLLSLCLVWVSWFAVQPISIYGYVGIDVLFITCVSGLHHIVTAARNLGELGIVVLGLLILELKFIGFSFKDGLMIFGSSYLIIYEIGICLLQRYWFTNAVTNFELAYFPKLDRIVTNELVMVAATCLLTVRLLWLLLKKQ